MNTIKQILQHHHQGRGIKWISRAVGVSKNTVRKYIGIVKQVGRPLNELLQYCRI